MTSLLECPVEIIQLIIHFLPKSNKDLASLALVNSHLNTIVTEYLYKWDDTPEYKRALHWAAFVGHIGTLRKFLDRGANPNSYWFSVHPGPWVPEFVQLDPTCTRPRYCGEGRSLDRYGREIRRGSFHLWNMNVDRDDIAFAELHDTDPIALTFQPQDYSWPTLASLPTLESSSSLRHFQYTVQRRGSVNNVNSVWTPLHLAVREGHLEVVQLLLSRGADPNMLSKGVCACSPPSHMSSRRDRRRMEWWLPLHLALCTGNDMMAVLLLNSGAPLHVALYIPTYIDRETDRHIGLAQEAVRLGRLGVLQYILESGIQKSVDLEDGYTETALDYAYLHGEWGVFDYLLSKGASLFDATGRRPGMLADAISKCDFENACKILNYGSLVDVVPFVDIAGEVPLIHRCLLTLPTQDGESTAVFMPGGLGLECLKLLIAQYEDLNAGNPERDNETPLMAAYRTRNSYAVQVLLASGADVNARDSRESTALLSACCARDGESILLFLSSGASMNIKDAAGCTPLSAAINTTHLDTPELTRLLLSHGASASLEDLITVLRKSDLTSARLIYSSLNPKPRSKSDMQRMFRAMWECDTASLGFVLDVDEDKVIIQDHRSVSRMLSYARSNINSVLLLLERGAKCDDVSTRGGSAVYWAVLHGRDPSFIQNLLVAGANPDLVRTSGRNSCALYEAVRFGPPNKRCVYVKLLLDHGANVNVVLNEIDNNGNAPQLVGKMFLTPFHRALSDLLNREVIEMMLQSKSMQSWNDDLKASYAAEAVRIGSVKLLERLMALGAADVVQRHLLHNGLNFELQRLQQIVSKIPSTLTEMNDSIEMVAFLSRNGADWSYRWDESKSGSTNRDILDSIISMAGSTYQPLLAQAKIELEAESTNGTFTFCGESHHLM